MHLLAVYLEDGGLNTIPSLRETLKRLSADGWNVHGRVVTDANHEASRFDDPSIELVVIGSRKARTPVGYIVDVLAMAFRLLVQHAWRRPDVIVAVEPRGLLVSLPLATLFRRPIVYWSLELMFADELRSRGQHFMRNALMLALRSVRHVVIQDRKRGEEFRREFGWRGTLLLAPNSGHWSATERKSDYVQRVLGVPHDAFVLLFMGTPATWSGMALILAAAENLPSDVCVVVHSRVHGWSDRYATRLEDLRRAGKIFVSAKPVDELTLTYLVASCNAGLLFYVEQASSTLGKNLRFVGVSSGKLDSFAAAGLPVLCGPNVTLEPLIEKYGAGVIVSDEDSFESGVNELRQRYAEYAAGSRRLFESEFAMSVWYPDLRTGIEEAACRR